MKPTNFQPDFFAKKPEQLEECKAKQDLQNYENFDLLGKFQGTLTLEEELEIEMEDQMEVEIEEETEEETEKKVEKDIEKQLEEIDETIELLQARLDKLYPVSQSEMENRKQEKELYRRIEMLRHPPTERPVSRTKDTLQHLFDSPTHNISSK